MRIRFATQNAAVLAAAAAIVIAPGVRAQTSADAPSGKPDAVIDLATPNGTSLVRGMWRYSDARLVEVDFRAAGSDGQPTGAPLRTYDCTPKAGATEFDDSHWPVIEPTSLQDRRGNGRICFNWYRIRITIPERIGTFDPTGATVVFETAVDDYAEIWVDGELTRALGQQGGSVVAGWNAANRLVVGRGVKPGQQIQIAVFGMNGPISSPPTNFIWLRYARLELFAGGDVPLALTPAEVNVDVSRLDPAMDTIVGPNPKIFKIADGFLFTEGPVWLPESNRLLFSDPNHNRIYSFTPNANAAGKLEVFRESSGYAGADIAEYRQPGSNGLTLDANGHLVINEHGNRRVVRLDENGRITVLADRYEGKRLNSPNDLVYRTDGTLFFTDPPFGLPNVFNDARKELPFSGVYSLRNGALRLLTDELSGPNGIALSPDERYLYVGNWDEKRKVVLRYTVQDDGTVTERTLFFDMTQADGEDAIDGIKVDVRGNVYVSGPGGLWVLGPDGKHLGTIYASKHVHNMAWGDADGKTLYLCARSSLYRMRLGVAGTHTPAFAAR